MKQIKLVRLCCTSVVGAILLVLSAAILLFPTYATIKSRFAVANEQIATLEREGVIARDVDVNALLARSQALVPKLASTVPISPTEYVARIRSLIPTGISLQQYALSEEKIVQISGIAQNRESLKNYIEILQNTKSVEVVDSPVSNFVKNKNSTFTMKITFKQ